MTTWVDGLPNNYSYARYGDSPYYAKGSNLKVLGDVDVREEAYEFSLLVVWQDKNTGELFAAADSGCSCPTPFGDLTQEGMKKIEKVEDLDSLFESLDYSDNAHAFDNLQRVGLFKQKVREALK